MCACTPLGSVALDIQPPPSPTSKNANEVRKRSSSYVSTALDPRPTRSLRLTPTARNPTAAIDKLSDDCLLEIFRAIRPIAPSRPSYGEFYSRTLIIERLMLVCKRWRDTLDSRPSFWNVIFLAIGRERSIRRASRWLWRSRTAPLHIYIFRGLTDTPPDLGRSDVAALVRGFQQALPRIRSLGLSESDLGVCHLFSPGGLSITTPVRPPFPITLQSLTSLSLHLKKENCAQQQLLQFLDQTPHLQTLSIGNFLGVGHTSSVVSLPHLRELTLLRSHKTVLDFLNFPHQTVVQVRLPLYEFPRYRNQSARDKIIAEYLPLSFPQSTTVFFIVAESAFLAPYLTISHEDTPTGRQCYIHLILDQDCFYADLKASFQLATEAIKNLGSVDTVHLDIQFTLLPESLVPWVDGFSNLRVLGLAGTYMYQVLADPLFAEVDRFPRLQTIALWQALPGPTVTQLEHWLAAREQGPRPVKLELHIV